MSITRSQGFLKAIAGKELATITSTGIAASAAGSIFTGSGFDTAGFDVGYNLYPHNTGNATIDSSSYTISMASAGTLTVIESIDASVSAGASITLRSIRSGSFLELFNNSTLRIYSGSKPSSADAAENGTSLVEFTNIKFANAAWDSTNSRGYVDLFGGTAIQATASATGTAAWFRLYGGGATVTGASASSVRLDGSIGVGTGDLQLSSTSITSGAVETVNSFKYAVPQS